MSGSHLSKEFFELVKSIGESRSKQEEDRIILKEIEKLKAGLQKKKIPPKTMKEFLIRMIYVEMLGHDATFGHIHAVKIVACRGLLEKRVGYLAVSLTLHADHEFIFLLINQMLTDLRSDNFLETSMALLTVCKLANTETIPAVQPLVLQALDHKQALVRKKAIMALHRFYTIDPQNLANNKNVLRTALCDKDPAVMGALLNLFIDLILDHPQEYKDLVPSFVNILKQVTEHRLPRDFDYHRLPAPWIQIKLLRILALLGHADQRTSQGMYETLQEVMKRADIGINVGYAIVYECVRTITHIYPNADLIEEASLSISRFISSDNHNLKYLGVNSLAAIVQIDAKYAAEHQMTVVDCLEDPDETLRRKTVTLLVSMTNPQNVTVIVQKLIAFLRTTTDVFLRKELVTNITEVAENHAPHTFWYIDTINEVFEIAGAVVKPDVAHSLMKLIQESAMEAVEVPPESPEEDIRVFAADTYAALLTKKVIPDILLQVICWVLGEYGHLSQEDDRHGIISKLVGALERPVDDESTKSWVFSALIKQVAHLPTSSASPLDDVPEVKAAISKYQHSIVVDLQQRAHEFAEFVKNPQTMRAVLPLDGEEVEVDSKLGFLDGFVQAALSNGARPYQSQDERDAAREEESRGFEERQRKNQEKSSSLQFQPYQRETAVQQTNITPVRELGNSTSANDTYAGDSQGGLKLSGVARAWGPVSAQPEPEPEPEPEPVQQSASNLFGPTTEPEPEPEPEPVRQTRRSEPVKQELSAREKKAQALFGGGGATTTGRRYQSKRTGKSGKSGKRQPTQKAQPTASQQKRPQPQPAQPTQQAPTDLLGDLFGSGGPAPTPQPEPQPAPVNDLLGDLFGATPQPDTVTAGNMDTSNVVGNLSLSTSPGLTPTPVTTPAVSASRIDHTDLFGITSQPEMKTGAAAMNPTIATHISKFPRSSVNDDTILDTPALQLSTYNVVAPTSTFVMLFITNKQPTELKNIQLKLQSPQCFEVKLEGDPARRQTANQLTTIIIPSLAGRTTSTQMVMLQCIHMSAIQIRQLRGQVAWPGTGNQNFVVPLSITDLLRPLPIQTAQFGGLWKQLPKPAEVKFGLLTPAVTSSQEYMSRMRSRVHIHPVQTVGQENICAGTLVAAQKNVNLVVLVHGQLVTNNDRKGVSISVRSKEPKYSQIVALAVKSSLNES